MEREKNQNQELVRSTQYYTTLQGGIEYVMSTTMLSFTVDLSLNKLAPLIIK